MKKKHLFLPFLILVLLSCNNLTKEEKVLEETGELHEHSSEQEEAIELDNGNKWKVNDNMIIYIREMEMDILKFKSLENKDYKNIATLLQKNIDLLTENCTMSGKAHDELHKWLVPFMDLVGSFSESSNVDESSSHFKELVDSFETFNTYFN